MNVVLIGFSGSGKSSVGVDLAARLGWELVDTDAEIERRSGKRIHEIFAQDGEPEFRRLEGEAVRGALLGRCRVVAVGGGAPVDPRNRRAMRKRNLVVLLDAGVETLRSRLAVDVADEPRPMLGAGVAGERIVALKAIRDPIYREAAHFVVATDGLSVSQVTSKILDMVGADDASPRTHPPVGEGLP